MRFLMEKCPLMIMNASGTVMKNLKVKFKKIYDSNVHELINIAELVKRIIAS